MTNITLFLGLSCDSQGIYLCEVFKPHAYLSMVWCLVQAFTVQVTNCWSLQSLNLRDFQMQADVFLAPQISVATTRFNIDMVIFIFKPSIATILTLFFAFFLLVPSHWISWRGVFLFLDVPLECLSLLPNFKHYFEKIYHFFWFHFVFH